MDVDFNKVWEAIPPFGFVQWFVVLFGSFGLIVWTVIFGIVILQICGQRASKLQAALVR